MPPMLAPTPSAPPSPAEAGEVYRKGARDAAALCREYAGMVRDEEGPSSDEPEYDTAQSCAHLIERCLVKDAALAPQPDAEEAT